MVKIQEASCFEYGSPCCLLNKGRQYFKKLVSNVGRDLTDIDSQSSEIFKFYRLPI